MEDDEERIQETLAQGIRNKEVVSLIHNWCRHAEISRNGGVGMIEQMYDVPIGHMGLRCKHVAGGSLNCWRLEDAVYEFYLDNCEKCKFREAVNLPNILEFVVPRQKDAEEKREAQAVEDTLRRRERNARHAERASLKLSLDINEQQILDIVDELDSENWESKDDRLEQQARLAPETFTKDIVDYLFDQATRQSVYYRGQIAKCLLNLSIDTSKATTLSIDLIRGNSSYQLAIDHITTLVDDLEFTDVKKLVPPLVSRALPPPPRIIMGDYNRPLDAEPIKTIYQARKLELNCFIEELFDSADLSKIRGAARTIMAIDENELYAKFARTIIGKLLRQKILLKDVRHDDDTVYYLREIAVNAFKASSKSVDKIIQSLLKDDNRIARKEAVSIYYGAMKHGFRKEIQIEAFHRTAFEKLLWMAVDDPFDRMENKAADFFTHTWDEFKMLAAEQMDGLIGAAVLLSEKLKEIDLPGTIIRTPTGLENLEKSNQRSSVNSLQGALIAWAALGASGRGESGIKDFLQLYRQLPDNQVQMQANTVAHFSNLITDARSMQLVLSELYGALMHGDARIRASAAKVVGDVDYHVRENFPDLIFEAYLALLTDPIVMVHKTALRELKLAPFPEDLKLHVRSAVLNLILAYAKDKVGGDFLVECIDIFVINFCNTEELAGETGKALCTILMTLEDGPLYHAVNYLRYDLLSATNYLGVVIKSLRSEYTRQISTDDCLTTIRNASENEIEKHHAQLNEALNDLHPLSPYNFLEATTLIAALSRVRRAADGVAFCQRALSETPDTKQNRQFRAEIELLKIACEVESDAERSIEYQKQLESWLRAKSELEEEEDEHRSRRASIPKSLLS